MKFADHLSKVDIQKFNSLRKASKKKKEDKPKPRKKLEVLTRKDIEELMGMNRDTYKRERGAVKRR